MLLSAKIYGQLGKAELYPKRIWIFQIFASLLIEESNLIMSDALTLSALEDEYISQDKLDYAFIYTDFGKINFTRYTTEKELKYKPKLVLNAGTVGASNPKMSEVLVVKDVIQRDMLAEPSAQRGTTPIYKFNPISKSDRETVQCATGDSSVTERCPSLNSNQVDLVDMELFAIAKVCEFYGFKGPLVKFVSDYFVEQPEYSWKDSPEHFSMKIRNAIEGLRD